MHCRDQQVWMTPEDSDLGLVQALHAGDDLALNALMDRHRDGLFRFVFRHVPNEADALELTQEVFVRAYFNIRKFKPTAKFVTWLYRIALNLCRDHSRSRAYHCSQKTISADAPIQGNGDAMQLWSTDRGPAHETAVREELNALERAIHELPEEFKSSLILTAIEGLSYAEAAEVLGLSEKAVGMKVYRARKLLLEKMNKMGF
jgi:RNA polymerase sigma factor (sigma-70 family)